jgi:hypothetical protein
MFLYWGVMLTCKLVDCSTKLTIFLSQMESSRLAQVLMARSASFSLVALALQIEAYVNWSELLA